MHSLSLLLFTVVLIIAVYSLPVSGKAVKSTSATSTATTLAAATTTKAAPGTTKAAAAVKPAAKAPAAKPAAKKKAKPAKKSKKPKQSPWKVPDADQKKLFNDYKTILRTKLVARHQNISATHQLEPTKYGVQTDSTSLLHHFLIKLPDGKYAHAIIGTNKDAKKPSPISETNASIRRTIYDNLAAAEA